MRKYRDQWKTNKPIIQPGKRFVEATIRANNENTRAPYF